MNTRCLIALLCAAFAIPPAAAAIVEEVFELPVEVKDIYGRTHRQAFTVTVFRDDARAKSPFMVISHGRANRDGRARLGRARYSNNARYFASRGFAVFVPTRIGYGVTGGPDVEDSGPCSRREFAPAFEAGAVQVIAVIRYAQAQDYVDREKGVLVGQSVGGAITLALSAKRIDGVLGAINFAGGSGGDPDFSPEEPCSEPSLRQVFARFGAAAKIPTLWLYSENDQYWGKESPHAWFRAYRAKGAAAEFVQLPPHGRDGHASFSRNPEAWRPPVERFLGRLGFAAEPQRSPVADAQALP